MSSHLDYEINKELGECYLFMNELEKAEMYYKKAMESNPEMASPYLGLATIEIQRNEYDNALAYYKKALKLEEKNDKSLAGIGLVQMEKQMYAEAFDSFTSSLELNPANMIALACLVKIAYLTNRIEEIIPVLHESVKVDENQNARITLAGCYISLDKRDEATTLLKQALMQEPGNEQATELLNHLNSLAA